MVQEPMVQMGPFDVKRAAGLRKELIEQGWAMGVPENSLEGAMTAKAQLADTLLENLDA